MSHGSRSFGVLGVKQQIHLSIKIGSFELFKMRPFSEVFLNHNVVFGDRHALLSMGDQREIVTRDLQFSKDKDVHSVLLAHGVEKNAGLVPSKFSFLIRCSVQQMVDLRGMQESMCFQYVVPTLCFDLYLVSRPHYEPRGVLHKTRIRD